MNKRITFIAMFTEESLIKIKSLTEGVNESLCKIPYGAYNGERKEVDTLPFHITLSAWNSDFKEEIISIFNLIELEQIKLKVSEVKIMNGKENSFVLYLGIEKNQELANIQKSIYEQLPSEKYNPDSFEFHITLHIDKDSQKILEIQEKISEVFNPFEIIIDKIGLFEIYPVKEIL